MSNGHLGFVILSSFLLQNRISSVGIPNSTHPYCGILKFYTLKCFKDRQKLMWWLHNQPGEDPETQ